MDSLLGIKRRVYLCILPLSILVLIFYLLFDINLYKGEALNLLSARILIVWYMICWFLVYKQRFIKEIEWVTLLIISISHVLLVHDAIRSSILYQDAYVFGDEVIWVPLVILFVYLALPSRTGLLFSFLLFSIDLSFSLLHFGDFQLRVVLDLVQFYTAYVVYVLVFYFANHLFRVFIELETVKKSAYVDALTGIGNRHRINEWLKEEKKRFADQGTHLSVLFFDLDLFKLVNDTYGHQTGDFVLQEMAALIKEHLPKEALFGRWGGEEFLIIIHKQVLEAYKLAEAFRNAIESYSFIHVGRLTASFGVTEMKKDEAVHELMQRVDEALYESKKGGRNQTTLK